MEIVLITGMSGSGKSVALNALEDAGYYCVDNLPPELLTEFVGLQQQRQSQRVAIAMDVRSADSLPLVPELLKSLRKQGLAVKLLFFDAATETLVHRYSETRRKHPLSQNLSRSEATDVKHVLMEVIELERELLTELREQAHVIDTSLIRPSQLQSFVKDVLSTPAAQLTLVFESFAFKRGIPLDADYLFDVRMLPNPHYEPQLRALTGLDAPVVEFLRAQPEVQRLQDDVEHFLRHWLDAMARDHRSYVTVAIGCTGGKHRSVYLVQRLAELFAPHWNTVTRHRDAHQA